MAKKYPEVPVEKLRRWCGPEELWFETTGEAAPLEGTIGQERAVNAIEFGLAIKTHGFNMYVAGPTGTGRNSTIAAFVKDIASKEKVPPDWCYVHNFNWPERPLAISLPAGMACTLAADMEELVKDCRIEIPRAFESEDYERQKNEIVKEFQAERDKLLARVQEKAQSMGFVVQMTPSGIATIPVVEGRPLQLEEFSQLEESVRGGLQKRSQDLQAEMNQVMAKIRKSEKKVKEKIKELDRQVALFAIGHLLDELKEKYADYEKVIEYLADVQEDIMQHIDDFRAPEKEQLQWVPVEGLPRERVFDKYKVNVIVDNCKASGAPVVMENNPTYYNLFGGLEYQAMFGTMVTDFNMIKAGAIHRANGGYLVVQALDVLLNPFSWEALKRVLKSKEIKIENMGEQYRAFPAATLKPEPIPVDVKVILAGDPWLYQFLYLRDPDFPKLFKVKADFDTQMDRTKEHINRFVSFISTQCNEKDLKHFDKTGVAKIIEYGSRLIEDQDKLTTRFIEISDIISEASFWASRDNSPYISGKHVERAIEEKVYRSNMIEERIQELIEEGVLMIDVEGEVVGQANGLSIYSLGDYAFGRPSRITARTYLGRAGVVNIERETEMSGRVHSKGVMILSGYLGGKYAHNKPLALSASLCFEQLYEEVEGDSASSVELYTILSSLSGVALKQGIAVTGSVNQKGEIQPIGGVTKKIEGFFDVCKAKGLNGEQGVIIPYQNVKNLMLKEEVVQAVKEGKFHIYAIETVDEGMEILTGQEAGERLLDGSYKRWTINYKVDKQLQEFANRLRWVEEREKKKPRRK